MLKIARIHQTINYVIKKKKNKNKVNKSNFNIVIKDKAQIIQAALFSFYRQNKDTIITPQQYPSLLSHLIVVILLNKIHYFCDFVFLLKLVLALF